MCENVFCEDCGERLTEVESEENFCPCGLGPFCAKCLGKHDAECEDKLDG